MGKFYEVFSNEKLNPLGAKLSWSHYRELLAVKNINAIKYYIKICEKNNLTKRELQEKIKNNEYNRLSLETKDKLISDEKLMISGLIPNPISIKNNSLNIEISEYVLKELVLNNLDNFFIQLGYGFTYVGNEFKVTELKKEHIGQIQVYMNYIDDRLKKINQDRTIGIIICK